MAPAWMEKIGSIQVPPLKELYKECHRLEKLQTNETHRMAALFFKMSIRYYADVRRQAQQSFYSALGAAIVGVAFFIWAVSSFSASSPGSAKALSTIAATLTQVIAGINFYLYGKTAKQFFAFHTCLERIDRFMLANSLCENLSSSAKKDEMRSELLRTVADAPLLTLDLIEGGQTLHKKVAPAKFKSFSKPATNGASPT